VRRWRRQLRGEDHTKLTFGAAGGGGCCCRLIKSNRLGVNLPLTKHGRAQIMGNANEPPNLKPNYAKIRQFIALYHAAVAREK